MNFKVGMILGCAVGMATAAMVIDHVVPNTMGKFVRSGKRMAQDCAQTLQESCQ